MEEKTKAQKKKEEKPIVWRQQLPLKQKQTQPREKRKQEKFFFSIS